MDGLSHHQALHPDQGRHLVLRQTELVLAPIEGVLVCVQQSLDWSSDHKAITLPVHEDSSWLRWWMSREK